MTTSNKHLKGNKAALLSKLPPQSQGIRLNLSDSFSLETFMEFSSSLLPSAFVSCYHPTNLGCTVVDYHDYHDYHETRTGRSLGSLGHRLVKHNPTVDSQLPHEEKLKETTNAVKSQGKGPQYSHILTIIFISQAFTGGCMTWISCFPLTTCLMN